jgi:hypothetical protein
MRFITEQSYPSNMRVFRATSYTEATLKASKHFEEEGVQAVIWGRDDFNRAVLDPVQIYRIHRAAWKAGDSDFISFNEGLGDHRSDLGVMWGPEEIEYYPDNEVFRALVPVATLQEMVTLFSYIAFRFRSVTLTNAIPHTDNVAEDELFSERKTGVLFGGLSIRAIEYEFNQTEALNGTKIYDPIDIGVSLYQEILASNFGEIIIKVSRIEPWYTRPSDMLFLTSQEWPKDRVCIHGEASYFVNDAGKARVLRVYDCHPK